MQYYLLVKLKPCMYGSIVGHKPKRCNLHSTQYCAIARRIKQVVFFFFKQVVEQLHIRPELFAMLNYYQLTRKTVVAFNLCSLQVFNIEFSTQRYSEMKMCNSCSYIILAFILVLIQDHQYFPYSTGNQIYLQ